MSLCMREEQIINKADENSLLSVLLDHFVLSSALSVITYFMQNSIHRSFTHRVSYFKLSFNPGFLLLVICSSAMANHSRPYTTQDHCCEGLHNVY